MIPSYPALTGVVPSRLLLPPCVPLTAVVSCTDHPRSRSSIFMHNSEYQSLLPVTLTTDAVADLLHVSRVSVRRWVRRGLLPAVTVGRQKLIRVDAISRLLTTGTDHATRGSYFGNRRDENYPPKTQGAPITRAFPAPPPAPPPVPVPPLTSVGQALARLRALRPLSVTDPDACLAPNSFHLKDAP